MENVIFLLVHCLSASLYGILSAVKVVSALSPFALVVSAVKWAGLEIAVLLNSRPGKGGLCNTALFYLL